MQRNYLKFSLLTTNNLQEQTCMISILQQILKHLSNKIAGIHWFCGIFL